MVPVKEWWTTPRGKRIFSWHILPVIPVKAVVLLCHGHGEHSWRYLDWAKRFAYHGYVFYAWDHPGHGRSAGQRGHIRQYEQFLLGVDRAIAKVREVHPDTPIVLYGHSMGGNIALNYAISRASKLDALIVTSPWLMLAQPPKPSLVFVSKVLNSILPFVPFTSPLKPEDLSHRKEVVSAYASDPLVHRKITPRLFVHLTRAADYAMRSASRIGIPVLLMHGDADAIALASATASLAARIPRSTFLQWTDAYHELHNEYNRDEVFRSIITWMEEHVDK